MSHDPQRKRVLVVDDYADTADSAALLLSLHGYDVRVAYDGPSALTEIGDFRPDAVLVDIALAGMDGYEVCRRLRSMPQQENTVAIAVTGFGRIQDVEQAIAAGFDHHLLKPADLQQIVDCFAKGRLPWV